MQQETAAATSTPTTSFAGLLAALTSPVKRDLASGETSFHGGTKPAARWSDDGLEDDITTLSYEHALRAHVRYRSTVKPLAESAEQEQKNLEDQIPATFPQPEIGRAAVPEVQKARPARSPFERNLKSASITIRLSKVECEQLHRRAADAGLTVSAYLRSCTFEAESLRAMVRDTLAELRLAKVQNKPSVPESVRRSGIRSLAEWLVRLLTLWHRDQRVARV